MEVKTYKAVCERSDGWWAISVPGVRGAHTQARRLDQAETMAREVIAGLLDVPEDSFAVEVIPQMTGELSAAVEEMVMSRAAAEQAQKDAHAAAARAARIATERMPLRDAGKILGISYQRVHQLLEN